MADSVLTPCWQTELDTHQTHHKPVTSHLQMQPAHDMLLGTQQQQGAPNFGQTQVYAATDTIPRSQQQLQQPFSSSLLFQAAHGTDFQQPSAEDTVCKRTESEMQAAAHAAATDKMLSDHSDAEHAADVEFAARFMRCHELDTSRKNDSSNVHAAESHSDTAAGQHAPGPACANDVATGYKASSSSQGSIGPAKPPQDFSVPERDTSLEGVGGATNPRLTAAADGRVLTPRNAADVPQSGSAASQTLRKHAGYADRAVGLVEPVDRCRAGPSVDVLIKTGHVVSLLQHPCNSLARMFLLSYVMLVLCSTWNACDDVQCKQS